MTALLEIALSNVVVSGLLAVGVFSITRCWRSPHVAHLLWILVLVKLVTPPLVSWHWPATWATQTPTAALAVVVHPVNPVATTAEIIAPTIESASTAILPTPPSDAEIAELQNTSLDNLPVTTATTEASPLVAPPQVAAVVVVPASEAPLEPGISDALPDLVITESSDVFDTLPASVPSTAWPGIAMPSSYQITRAMAWIWKLGSLAVLCIIAIRIVRFHRSLRDTFPAGRELQSLTVALAEQSGLRKVPRVRMVQASLAPFVWPLGQRVSIILPMRMVRELDRAALSTILLHEMAHIRRGDHWVRWLELATTALYWWNPVLWLARRELHRAEEECCDAWVAASFPEQRRLYGQTLLMAAEMLLPCPRPAPLASSAFSRQSLLSRRLDMILNGTPAKRLSRAGLLAICLVALAVLPVAALSGEQEKASDQPGIAAETAVADKELPDPAPADAVYEPAPTLSSAAPAGAAEESAPTLDAFSEPKPQPTTNQQGLSERPPIEAIAQFGQLSAGNKPGEYDFKYATSKKVHEANGETLNVTELRERLVVIGDKERVFDHFGNSLTNEQLQARLREKPMPVVVVNHVGKIPDTLKNSVHIDVLSGLDSQTLILCREIPEPSAPPPPVGTLPGYIGCPIGFTKLHNGDKVGVCDLNMTIRGIQPGNRVESGKARFTLGMDWKVFDQSGKPLSPEKVHALLAVKPRPVAILSLQQDEIPDSLGEEILPFVLATLDKETVVLCRKVAKPDKKAALVRELNKALAADGGQTGDLFEPDTSAYAPADAPQAATPSIQPPSPSDAIVPNFPRELNKAKAVAQNPPPNYAVVAVPLLNAGGPGLLPGMGQLRLDSEGNLQLKRRTMRMIQEEIEAPDGQAEVKSRPIFEEQIAPLVLGKYVQVFDRTGKQLDEKEVRETVVKPRTVVEIFTGGPIPESLVGYTPLLESLAPETLIVWRLPAPPAPAALAPQAAIVSAPTPISSTYAVAPALPPPTPSSTFGSQRPAAPISAPNTSFAQFGQLSFDKGVFRMSLPAGDMKKSIDAVSLDLFLKLLGPDAKLFDHSGKRLTSSDQVTKLLAKPRAVVVLEVDKDIPPPLEDELDPTVTKALAEGTLVLRRRKVANATGAIPTRNAMPGLRAVQVALPGAAQQAPVVDYASRVQQDATAVESIPAQRAIIKAKKYRYDRVKSLSDKNAVPAFELANAKFELELAEFKLKQLEQVAKTRELEVKLAEAKWDAANRSQSRVRGAVSELQLVELRLNVELAKSRLAELTGGAANTTEPEKDLPKGKPNVPSDDKLESDLPTPSRKVPGGLPVPTASAAAPATSTPPPATYANAESLPANLFAVESIPAVNELIKSFTKRVEVVTTLHRDAQATYLEVNRAKLDLELAKVRKRQLEQVARTRAIEVKVAGAKWKNAARTSEIPRAQVAELQLQVELAKSRLDELTGGADMPQPEPDFPKPNSPVKADLPARALYEPSDLPTPPSIDPGDLPTPPANEPVDLPTAPSSGLGIE